MSHPRSWLFVPADSERKIAKALGSEADAIIQKYPEEVGLMAASAAGGYNLGYETSAHMPNAKANDIIASNVLAEMVQRVVLNGEDAKAVLGDTSTKLDALMKA